MILKCRVAAVGAASCLVRLTAIGQNRSFSRTNIYLTKLFLYAALGDFVGLHASCLCGGIAFEIDGPIRDPLYCHCIMCRKAHGTAFRARGRIRTVDVRWLRGPDLLRFYESSEGEHRGFCSVCGSNIYTKFDARPHELGLALGVLDDDPGIRPMCHVFVASKAPWHEITDSLPQYQKFQLGHVPR